MPDHFLTTNTRFASPGEAAVMLVVALAFAVFVTVNWPLRFVGEPEPVTLTGEVTVNFDLNAVAASLNRYPG